MKWKSPNTKSAAGICKHKTILPLSLKSNWLFGKWSPHQWPKEWPDPCQQGRWGGEKLASELCHCPEPAWRGPENQAGQKKSCFPQATYSPAVDTQRAHGKGRPQGSGTRGEARQPPPALGDSASELGPPYPGTPLLEILEKSTSTALATVDRDLSDCALSVWRCQENYGYTFKHK